MPQQAEAKLNQLTEVPAGWPLATVIDAFCRLACYIVASRAHDAVSCRLVDLWASQPAEAQAWLERCRERFATELSGKETRPEELEEALRRHGAAECGKYVGRWRFSEAGLLRGEPCGSAWKERLAYLQKPYIRDRCRELAERLAAAESPETARKRQKLEEESSERRRLEAELHTSQEEGRELRNRLAAAEAEVFSKDAELQTAQSESTKCKEQCEELASRAAAAESAAAEMQKELRQLQEEHVTCRERCEELLAGLEAEAAEHAKTEERLSRAEADAAERRMEAERLQEKSRSCQERCQQAEVARLASAAEPGSKAELQLEKEKAVLQERCEQLRQQLQQTSVKAEAERSAMLGQLQVMWEEKGTHKERIRELERQLREGKKQQASHHSNSQHVHPSISVSSAASSEDEPDLAELFGYSFVDEDRASILSGSSQSSVEQNCFMLDSMFKVRMDVFRAGRDLQKGSQVVAGDGKTVCEVVEIKEARATEVVDLRVGTDTLRVTPDHRVQVPDVSGQVGRRFYREAGELKPGDLVMIAPGEPVALTGAETHPMECKVLKIVFQPDLPVPVFSGPTCILSKGHEKKSRGGRRGGMRQRGKEASDPTDGASDPTEGASIPDTAAGEYMD